MKKEIRKKLGSKQKSALKPINKNHLFQNNNLLVAYLFLLGIIFIFVYNYVYDNKIYLGGDNAVYYITGCSLAEGHGYTNIHLSEQSPANHFPPGYPFIISIIVRFFGENMDIVKKANGVFLFASIIILFLIIKEITKNINLAFIVCLIAILNRHLLQFSCIEMSEIPFAFFILLSVWFFIKTFNKGKTLKQPYFWLLAASIIISFYIRSMGIALLGASLLVLAINKRWLQVILLIVCFILAYAPWYIRSENLGGNTYSKQVMMVNPYRPELGNMSISDFPKRFVENIDRYLGKEINLAYSGKYISDYKIQSSWIDYIFSIVLLVLTAIGIISLKNFRLFILFFISGTFLILMLWPSVWVSVRFILPIVPLLLFLSIQGTLFSIRKLSEQFSENKIYWNVAPFIFLILTPVLETNITQLNQSAISNYPESFIEYFDLAAWCKEQLPDTANICTRKPELFYLYAHHKVCGIPLINNSDEFISYLKKQHITHVVVDNLHLSSTSLFLIPAINNNIENFRTIKQFNKTYLVEFLSTDSIRNNKVKDNDNKVDKELTKNLNGEIYKGTYNNNMKDGLGKLTKPDGSFYEGEFKNDMKDGNGKLYFTNGNYLKGRWENDMMVGEFLEYNKEGKIVGKSIYKISK